MSFLDRPMCTDYRTFVGRSGIARKSTRRGLVFVNDSFSSD
jgi:hypothetical protein